MPLGVMLLMLAFETMMTVFQQCLTEVLALRFQRTKDIGQNIAGFICRRGQYNTVQIPV